MKLIELPWLQPVPDDFRQTVRALREAPVRAPDALRAVANTRLTLTQLTSLDRAMPTLASAPELPWLRLSILSNATTDLLVPAIRCSGVRHELWLDVATGEFGSYVQDALDPQSATRQRNNDFVLLALDHRALGLVACPGDEARAPELVEAALATLRNMTEALQANPATTVIVQTLADLPAPLFGNLDACIAGTETSLIAAFNGALRRAPPPACLLLDVARLASTVGLAQWHDRALWNAGKFAFAHEAVPLYAEQLCRLLMAARGKARKCLVLDLDNTLWGGVIGDDGLDGIVLGQGSPLGEAHLAVQEAALALRARGIVLAVSSKNDEAVARSVFQQHPDMLLREEHIAVFQANWQDKASNLRAIAETLNIGLDALVFLDDNPAEREQVRLALPMVAVPELPDSPEHFAELLLLAGYFEAVQFTVDDRARAAQYQANAMRSASLGATGNLDDYLASLDMQADIAAFDKLNLPRIAQLINKTNQFNLTTVRHSEAEVAAMARDPHLLGLHIRLQDRFGDNGIVSILICRLDGGSWIIDSWLMSCRVLNRRLEQAVLDCVAAMARSQGATSLVGLYRPSARNGMVEHHYARLGFAMLAADPAAQRWELALPAYQPFRPAIKVVLDAPLQARFPGAGAPADS